MRKPPIQPHEKRPPYTPILTQSRSIAGPGLDRMFWDQNWRMWILTTVRRRTYICSLGDEHKTYYRTHWRQGREDWVACEHEVNQ